MNDMISENDHSLVESRSSFSISQIEEVKLGLYLNLMGMVIDRFLEALTYLCCNVMLGAMVLHCSDSHGGRLAESSNCCRCHLNLHELTTVDFDDCPWFQRSCECASVQRTRSRTSKSCKILNNGDCFDICNIWSSHYGDSRDQNDFPKLLTTKPLVLEKISKLGYFWQLFSSIASNQLLHGSQRCSRQLRCLYKHRCYYVVGLPIGALLGYVFKLAKGIRQDVGSGDNAGMCKDNSFFSNSISLFMKFYLIRYCKHDFLTGFFLSSGQLQVG
ncbi:hypothetical protein LOK49_LG12G00416 [Camellia lanceoleosa]|uniref:Uncharacterized protein n=1 Tax=Camellia lanceoleosa TaxID=1840588 RepID=A0ACC0FQ56_9ERIC|nr:hypothetical protein LOK49_LG12G00416 [Camellia lanceoleosa]